jgi:hypothetical protein
MADLDDFGWLDLDEPFVVGANYYIKDGNSWELYEYKGFDPKHVVDAYDKDKKTYPVHIFKTKYGTSYKSVPYVEELVSRNLIKPYEEDFNFYQQLNIKINLENLKPNFVIVFKNGVNVQDTYELQERLLEMGYTWYHRGERLLTDKDVSDNIFTIESVNWDTSNRLYSRMNTTFGDRKILMLSTLDDSEDDSNKERRLNFIHDHPEVQVIDGDDLLSKI